MAHSHDHSHNHSHSHTASVSDAYSKTFIIGISLNILFVIVEVAAGLIYGSIALLTDAGHNAGDVASLVLSLIAIRLSRRKPTKAFTYGYKKTTILAAFINAVILLIAIGILGYESVDRLKSPEPVQGNSMAWIAGLGIVINGISAWLFFKNKEKELNSKSAYLHLLSDALVSVGVVIAGIIIFYTNWYWLDPIIGLLIMIVILVSTWNLLRDSFKMAVDAVPEGIDSNEIKQIIEKVEHVCSTDHIHIWSLSTTENALTAHVVLDNKLTFEEKLAVVHEIKHELSHQNIQHSTIEMDEVAGTDNCENVN